VTDCGGDLLNLYVVPNCTQKRTELVNDPIVVDLCHRLSLSGLKVITEIVCLVLVKISVRTWLRRSDY